MSHSTEDIESSLSEEILDQKDRLLLNALFGLVPYDESVASLTGNLNLDDSRQDFLLMLSILGQRHHYEGYPDDITPRLKGVYRYFQVRNTLLLPWVMKRVGKLQEKGIRVMLIKGAAMRVFFLPGLPRQMNDVDIAIAPEDRFEEALDTIKQMGYDKLGHAPHSASIRNGYMHMDLHRWAFKDFAEKDTGMWERAVTMRLMNQDVLIPEPMDMIVHLLDNQSRNIILFEASKRHIKWIFDLMSVIQHLPGGLDMEALASRSREFHAFHRVHLMLSLSRHALPGLCAQEDMDRFFPCDKAYRKWLENAVRYREVYKPYLEATGGGGRNWNMRRILLMPKFKIREYRYLKDELRLMDPELTFFRFIWNTPLALSIRKRLRPGTAPRSHQETHTP